MTLMQCVYYNACIYMCVCGGEGGDGSGDDDDGGADVEGSSKVRQ